MKININNQTLLCKDQRLICENCLFRKKIMCSYTYPLCRDLDIIFLKHDSSDLFNL